MKFVYWNWVWKPWDWKIWKENNSFRANRYYGVDSWGKIIFHEMNNKSSPRKWLIYKISKDWIMDWELTSSSSLFIHSERAFRRFIKKRIKPIENTLEKWTVIELVGKYVWQESIFYIVK